MASRNQKQNENINIRIDMACVACGAKTLVMPLRDCGHWVCIQHFHKYLKFWIMTEKKARIKCMKSDCHVRIHENDIKFVLDPKNSDLDPFMPLPHRMWLQHQHDKHVIFYALGGTKFAKQCPLCKCIYQRRWGCNYVKCANIRCQTRFCWDCGSPVKNLSHFTLGGSCRVSTQDIIRSCYPLYWLNETSPVVMAVMMPAFIIVAVVFLPIMVLFGIPYHIVKRQKERFYDNIQDEPTTEEMDLYKFKVITLCISSLPFALLLALCSLVSAPFIILLYWAAIPIRMCVSTLTGVLEKISYIFVCSSYCRELRMLFKGTCDEKMKKLIEEEQKKAEGSERLAVIVESDEDEEIVEQTAAAENGGLSDSPKNPAFSEDSKQPKSKDSKATATGSKSKERPLKKGVKGRGAKLQAKKKFGKKKFGKQKDKKPTMKAGKKAVIPAAKQPKGSKENYTGAAKQTPAAVAKKIVK